MSSTTASGALHNHRQRRKYLALASVTAALPMFAYFGTTSTWMKSSLEPGLSFQTPSSSSSSSDDNGRLIIPRLLNAEEIIQRSYRNTFGALSTDRLCSPDVGAIKCVNSILSEAMELSSSSSSSSQQNNTTATTSSTTSSSTKSFPWWFITMLRDVKGKSGINGGWHNLTIMNPPMDFCTIEKVATTQWRNVQCVLNDGKNISKQPMTCHLNKTRLADRRNRLRSAEQRSVSRVVILRDPLERLLSGYLNKCFGLRRKVEGHCEPNTVFNETDLTLKIRQDPKQLFAAYVDGFPLKWNVHFFPQSMYCDGLFRHARDYDFIGYMGTDFYGDLTNLTAKLGRGNKLGEALQKVFHFSDESSAPGNSNVGTETQAPDHVKEYYTPASVRRALEIFAVDYITLGLEVPSWVHDILAEESEMFMV